MNNASGHKNSILGVWFCLICVSSFYGTAAKSDFFWQPLPSVSVPDNAGKPISAEEKKRVQEIVSDIKQLIEAAQQRASNFLKPATPKPPGIEKDQIELVLMGPKVIPALTPELDDSITASYIGEVLGRFGRPAAAAIVDKIIDRSLTIKTREDRPQNSIDMASTGGEVNGAHNALMFIGLPALPEIVRIFKQKDAKVGALWTARNIISKESTVRPLKTFDAAPLFVSQICDALSDPVPVVRALAACTLQHLKPNKESTRKLVQLLNSDSDSEVRIAVADALGVVGYQLTDANSARPLIDALGMASASGDMDVRCMSLMALGHFRSAQELALKTLAPYCDDANGRLQSYAKVAKRTLTGKNGEW